MKKLVSVLFALFLLFAISVTANAAEVPLRLFSVAPDEGFSEEEVYSYAIENNNNVKIVPAAVRGTIDGI